MATAQQVIEKALRKIQVKGAETPLSSTELDDGLDTLNQMNYELESEGFELFGGYTDLALGDTVPVSSYALNFIILQLAGRLAPEYLDGEIPAFLPDLIRGARRIVVRALNRKSVGVAGTYQNLIYGAIELLDAKASSEPISAAEITNALPRLNDLMTEIEAKGFRLNYNISDGSDMTAEHGLPDWCWSWIKATLAIRLSSSYSVQPNEVILSMAANGETSAYNRYGTTPVVDYPETLPIGSSRYYEAEFFSDTESNDLLTGSGGILLDDEGNPLEVDY